MDEEEEICPDCGEPYSDCECEEDEDDLDTAPPSKAYPRIDYIDYEDLPF